MSVVISSLLNYVSPYWNGERKLERVRESKGNPNAALFLLGDIHTDKSQKKLRKSVIDRFAKPGDIVLLESVQRFLQIRPDSQYETIGRNDLLLFGWDDIEMIMKANRLTDQMCVIREKLREYKEEDSLPRRRIKWAMEAEAIQCIGEINDLDLIGRNQSLLKTISTIRALCPNNRIFVIAGEDHLDDQKFQNSLKEPFYHVNFTENQSSEKSSQHLAKIRSKKSPDILSHAREVADAVGPFTLLKPRKKSEDLRSVESSRLPWSYSWRQAATISAAVASSIFGLLYLNS